MADDGSNDPWARLVEWVRQADAARTHVPPLTFTRPIPDFPETPESPITVNQIIHNNLDWMGITLQEDGISPGSPKLPAGSGERRR